MELWSSARRATARRRPLDRILVAGVEKKMPLIGGSHWEALFLNARGRTASVDRFRFRFYTGGPSARLFG
eukprot:200856-Pelagomonas_calceolata.AAC.2